MIDAYLTGKPRWVLLPHFDTTEQFARFVFAAPNVFVEALALGAHGNWDRQMHVAASQIVYVEAHRP